MLTIVWSHHRHFQHFSLVWTSSLSRVYVLLLLPHLMWKGACVPHIHSSQASHSVNNTLHPTNSAWMWFLMWTVYTLRCHDTCELLNQNVGKNLMLYSKSRLWLTMHYSKLIFVTVTWTQKQISVHTYIAIRQLLFEIYLQKWGEYNSIAMLR